MVCLKPAKAEGAKLISKRKHICRQKKRRGQQTLTILATAIFMGIVGGGISQAKAADLPGLAFPNLKNIIKKKKVIIYNQLEADNSSGLGSLQLIIPEKSVPRTIDNPIEMEQAAEFASQATGVRKDFLMGMLTVESDLGKNTGKCTYGEVEQGSEEAHNQGRLSSTAWKTFQERRHVIKKLASDLGYDAEQLRVSCNPGTYAGTGGALGVAQFMPDIWMLYRDEVASIVGKENPDPWDAKDGAVAMALLLADTPGVTEHNYYAERNSAKMYLSGTTSGVYNWYADQAMYWSRNYARARG